jgi:hypothetical protein
MKYLKITNNKVEYTLDQNSWKEIDQIDKHELLQLISIAVNNEFEMDEYDKDTIGNQAHQIIYKNIYEKFNELIANKDRFHDESEALFKEAYEKYSIHNSDSE